MLSAVKVDAYQSCFVSSLNSLRDAAQTKNSINSEEKTRMAIDGKTMKRNHNRGMGLGRMQKVSAWLSQFGLTMAQFYTEEKFNGITAIPELTRIIDRKSAIITIDAMGTQVAFAD